MLGQRHRLHAAGRAAWLWLEGGELGRPYIKSKTILLAVCVIRTASFP